MKRLPLVDITPIAAGLYAPRQPIRPRVVKGRYSRRRLGLGMLWLGLFFSLPWLRWDGQPAVWVDLPRRRLHLFGALYWPEDLYLLAIALAVAAFALFWVTVLAGRIWCGYACPQTLWTALFRWCERITEGPRGQRAQGSPARRRLRSLAKHLLWLALSGLTALTLVALFIPMERLLPGLAEAWLPSAVWAWLAALTLGTYGNAGWLREQLCLYLCPYGRFQAVMLDAATPVVTYDRQRGEPRRGPRDAIGAGGACVDCTLCVQVCPTGIDIRDGQQLACIACGACVDACDAMMTRLNLATGLVAYRPASSHVRRQGLRPGPRLLGYGLVLLAASATLAWAVTSRPLVSFSASKDRQLYRDAGDGTLENVYTLTILNKDRRPHAYRLSAQGPAGLLWRGPAELHLGRARQGSLVVSLALPHAQAHSQPLRWRLESDDGQPTLEVPGRFLGPSP